MQCICRRVFVNNCKVTKCSFVDICQFYVFLIIAIIVLLLGGVPACTRSAQSSIVVKSGTVACITHALFVRCTIDLRCFSLCTCRHLRMNEHCTLFMSYQPDWLLLNVTNKGQ